jgi:hypothetical protein
MKLQPNYSWQKYEGKPEDQKEQFQYQLQNQHIQVSNSVNATIDDASFFTRERMTSFTWTDGRAIWTKTISGTIVGTSSNTTAHGITNLRQLVRIYGTAQNAVPLSANAFPLPYLDPNTLANGLGLFADPTNIYVVAANNAWANYIFNVTLEYTKGV